MKGQPTKDNRFQELRSQLPLYLSGEIDPQESQELEALLAQDAELRRELSELSELRGLLREYRAGFPEPPPDAFERIKERIEEQGGRSEESRPWRLFQLLRQALPRAFSSPGLAWALAGILLVIAIGLGIHTTRETRFLTLSTQQETTGELAVINAVFRDDAPLKEVESLLQEINAGIIGGPYRDGLYVLAVNPGELHSALERARQSPVVRYIAPAVPGSTGQKQNAQPRGNGG